MPVDDNCPLMLQRRGTSWSAGVSLPQALVVVSHQPSIRMVPSVLSIVHLVDRGK